MQQSRLFIFSLLAFIAGTWQGIVRGPKPSSYWFLIVFLMLIFARRKEPALPTVALTLLAAFLLGSRHASARRFDQATIYSAGPTTFQGRIIAPPDNRARES